MSGRAKRIVYRAADTALFLAAVAAMALCVLFTLPKPYPETPEFIATSVLIVAVLARLPVLLHEAGHLLFGLLAGMKLASFRVSLFGSDTAGATEMFPGSGDGVKAKFCCFALGGAAFNLLLSGGLFALYFCLPYHPALLFCVMFAPFCAYEGIRALLPASLPAGKTDGAVLLGVLRGDPEEEVMLRVLRAQGILYRGVFSDVPRELLFGAPVVREDLPAFHALLLLKTQFLLFEGKRERAKKTFDRLTEIEGLTPAEQAEAERYGALFKGGAFRAGKCRLHGVRVLEQRLADRPSGTASPEA